VVNFLAAAGCSSITVRPAHAPDLLEAWRVSTVEADELSPRALQTLRRWDLDQLHRRRPADAFARLQNIAVQEPQPDVLFALAEMSFLLGRAAEKNGSSQACVYYYLCAGYAFHYLFPDCHGSLQRVAAEIPDLEAPGPLPPALRGPTPCGISPSAFDPRFRLACDLYNAGLAKCIRAAERIGNLDPRHQLQLPTPDGRGYTLSVSHHGFDWKPTEFGPLLFAEDYEVVGLANQYRGYGLGVPLIGTRDANAPAPKHAFYPREVSFPVTAFFRFEGSLAELGARRSGRLELYNPLTVRAADVRGRAVPLETDLTTPLAYFLAHTDLDTGVTGFLHVDKVQKRSGIYMFEPYQPGKIPVLMVHGLLSSPLTWATLFNDLRADPELRKHFQFWFYLYPSGNPYLATAADLRDTLAELRTGLDPHHADRALDELVMVGHSMGGLVSRLLTAQSQGQFFRLVSTEPIDSLKARPETRVELRRVFYFERVSSVRRVIFLATPHHGSRLSPSWPGRLAARLVSLPSDFLAAAGDLAAENPKGATDIDDKHLPTSVDLLAPNAPALELLAAEARPDDVHFHSIIGVLPCGGPVARVLSGDPDGKGTDGIVPYSSAHLEGVDSELVVPTDHTHVHHHALAVLEVRRILLQHLRGVVGPP
jgi:pimeloyl-ACP methyl ester carboxylesterase